MSEQYIKAEIVKPKPTAENWFSQLISGLLMTAFRVLIVWWFVAAWFPDLGLTFWQLVLPVYAARLVFGDPIPQPRILK